MVRYNWEYEGVNSRLDEVQAGYLDWKLKGLDSANNKRNALARTYIKELKGLPIILPPQSDSFINRVWHLFVIRTQRRDELKDFLYKNGVGTLIHYPYPIFKMNAYRFLKVSGRGLEITERSAKEVLSLPLYTEMKISEVKEVCRLIKSFFAT